ncbi:MAG: FAD-dependent oxidoreductase [Chloroflexota bacterium]
MSNRKPKTVKKLTRRDFLKDAGVVAAGVTVSGLAACASQEPTSAPPTSTTAATEPPPTDVPATESSPTATVAATEVSASEEEGVADDESSVIVIGAGVAGLAAASQLKAQGFKQITILEARDRIGGRVFTDRSLGVPVDMGASWIHGPDGGNPITDLAEAAGATTYLTDDESLEIYDVDGYQISDDILESAYDYYLELLDDVDASAASGQSLFEALQEIDADVLSDPLMMYQLSAYAEFSAGAAIEALDADQWDEDEVYPGSDVLFPNGYDAIINHLAHDLDIRRTHVVESISTDSTGVDVQTNQGLFTADYCVCTLPIGVLKAGDVAFDPPLPPEFQQAIDRMGIGHVNKVALQFPERFWDNSLQYMGYTAPVKGQYPYILNVSKFVPDVNMLMTFGLGSYGLTMEGQSDEQIKDDIMTMLTQIYDEEAVQPEAMLVSRWTEDPYSKCSYSFAGTMTQPSHFEQFEESISDRLYFAGEHTEVDYRGTVHGAYLSGLRAAGDIISEETG